MRACTHNEVALFDSCIKVIRNRIDKFTCGISFFVCAFNESAVLSYSHLVW